MRMLVVNLHLFLFAGVAPPTVRSRDVEDVVDQQHPTRGRPVGALADTEVAVAALEHVLLVYLRSNSIFWFMKYAIWHDSDTWRSVPFEWPEVWSVSRMPRQPEHVGRHHDVASIHRAVLDLAARAETPEGRLAYGRWGTLNTMIPFRGRLIVVTISP